MNLVQISPMIEATVFEQMMDWLYDGTSIKRNDFNWHGHSNSLTINFHNVEDAIIFKLMFAL